MGPIEPLESRRLMSASLHAMMLPILPDPVVVHNQPTTTTAPDPQGVDLVETATQQFTRSVGSFNAKALPKKPVIDALIDWGDGSESAGKVVLSHGRATVIGTHTYAATGTYSVTTTVTAHPKLKPGQPQNFMPVIITTIHSTVRVMGRA